jgi:Uma2 family endonuclease
MITLPKTYTYQELLNEFDEKTRCEIIENKLFMSPAPNTEHQEISRDLEFLLYTFTRENNLGKVFDAPFDVILDENNVVQPDILFITNQNIQHLSKKGYHGAPDLIIEIVSPSTFYRDCQEKKSLYEKFGVKEYWIVEPANQVIEIFILENNLKNNLGNTQYQLHQFVAEKGKVSSKLLEGFEVDCGQIFHPSEK